MKLTLNVTLASLLLVGSAAAADMRMPVKAPPPAPAPVAYNWSGCYLGGQVGWARQRDRLTETFEGVVTDETPLTAAKPDGFKGGGHVGCNWQWGGPWVFGLEGDAEYADLKARLNYFEEIDYYETRTRFQASFRGRLGVAFDRSLLYVTGGVAWANVKHTYVGFDAFLVPTSESHSKTLTGWTVGAGWEYAFGNNWSGRVEYRYADFGDVTHITVAAFAGGNERHSITEHAVRVGLSYKFGGFGAPVVARY
jgi:outer membrane immunogenic protein